ncbi:MAG TPA: alcohol dehydrogenase catalytic domain-containing protein [Trebonia sp.]
MEPGRIEVRDVPVPDIGPTEVLVKVAGAGLCHSDLDVLHIPQPVFPPGMTLGHETAGYVAAAGRQVTGLSEGGTRSWCRDRARLGARATPAGQRRGSWISA